MGILPHVDVEEALKASLSVDIPFWPQLPKISFFEDMYVQAMEHFPGAVIDADSRRIWVDTAQFMDDVPVFLENEDDDGYFALSRQYSKGYHTFLDRELECFGAIHGQVISPISLTLKIMDESGRPIVYNDELRSFAYSFIQRKVNVQYEALRKRNGGAFVWLDDPGLEFVFSGLCGYEAMRAKQELAAFFEGVKGPRGIHLCGRPDWDFLLSLNIEVLSFNAFAFGETFVAYDKVVDFLDAGNTISWGIVPTACEDFSAGMLDHLVQRLEGMWRHLEQKGCPLDRIVRQSLIAPATCNLVNVDGTATVEGAFTLLNTMSSYLKDKYLS